MTGRSGREGFSDGSRNVLGWCGNVWGSDLGEFELFFPAKASYDSGESEL